MEKYINNFYKILKSLIITNNEGRSEIIGSSITNLVKIFSTIRKESGIVYLIGNGGSSSIVSHVSIDLINSCNIKAVPITDNSQLTCFANDYGYENVFSKPLEVYLSKSDLLIAVSSSGNSRNIINASIVARSKGCYVLTFTGFKPDNPLRKLGDLNFWLESSHYGMVETGHALILHFLTDQIYSNRMK